MKNGTIYCQEGRAVIYTNTNTVCTALFVYLCTPNAVHVIVICSQFACSHRKHLVYLL